MRTKLSHPDDNIFDRQALRVIGRDGCLRHGRPCCLPRIPDESIAAESFDFDNPARIVAPGSAENDAHDPLAVGLGKGGEPGIDRWTHVVDSKFSIGSFHATKASSAFPSSRAEGPSTELAARVMVSAKRSTCARAQGGGYLAASATNSAHRPVLTENSILPHWVEASAKPIRNDRVREAANHCPGIAVVEEIANLSLPFIPSGVFDDAQRSTNAAIDPVPCKRLAGTSHSGAIRFKTH
jgi:hypothetical protein